MACQAEQPTGIPDTKKPALGGLWDQAGRAETKSPALGRACLDFG